MMTKVDLQRVLDLDAQATEGPWEADFDEVSQHWSRPEPWATIVSSEVDCMAYCYGGTARGVESPEDAELIAHYRTAAPAMAKALYAVLEIAERAESKGAYEPNFDEAIQAIHYYLGNQYE